jgi:tRNA A-37 threonylcarbamoyl transferase component Bud32/tetratricopeptide (TPR) repeat protein
VTETEGVDPLIGRVIGDAYVVQALLGIGGMGRVYRAEQKALGRVVAVKVVHRHLLGDRYSITRFYTEARAASSLNHPNSVSVFDFGRTDDGILYLVMEHLRGKDLARIMHEDGQLPFGRIIDIGCGILGALGEAHERGVVHRDLKPENVIIERLRGGADLVKVVDFGLAKVRGVEPAEAAKGLVAGTPDYMAPEQARALEVDGRSDLYALGVLLFELLTGRLPFVDDTPSKVMTRHVMDPVPNPQEVAPYRGIPDELSTIVMRALEKDPRSRFQDAESMGKALRHAAAALRLGGDRVRCPSCGAFNETARSFCGDCGRRLSMIPAAPGTGLRSLPPPGERPLVGRAEVFAQLLAHVRGGAEARSEARAAYVIGELGIGKTRFLAELRVQAEREGFLVVESVPHESGAPVAYGGIRKVLERLLNVSADRLAGLADDDLMWRDALARAGLREVLTPEGLPGHDGLSRTGAVAATLARAVELASSRSELGRVVLVFDDLSRCDGLTAQTLEAFQEFASRLPVHVVVSANSTPLLARRWPGLVLELGGIDVQHAREFMRKEFEVPEVPGGGMMPLHLEQLRALRWEPTPDDPDAPSLAESVMRRLALLDIDGRRILQMLAVQGERISLGTLRKLLSAEDMPVVGKLVEAGFLRRSEHEHSFAHPYLRDFVEASIPAETRKMLHARCLDLANDDGAALEVRAEHAFRAGDLMTALMLLERMGQEALKRGDPSVSVLAFRRGLELARRTMLETGDEALDPAIVSFSRQLAESLVSGGDVTGAAGVLNEALQLAGPATVERARMTLVLGRVAERRDRPREAVRQIGLAAELAQKLGNKGLEARALWALARLRKSEGDGVGAANAMTAAAERLIDAEPRSAKRALIEVELGELLVELGDIDSATEHLERALDLATDGEWASLSAGAVGALGAIDELQGRRREASQRYREAGSLAARAGDAAGRDRWRKAAQALSG